MYFMTMTSGGPWYPVHNYNVRNGVSNRQPHERDCVSNHQPHDCLLNLPDSNVDWTNVGPTSGRQYRPWAYVGPTYIAVWAFHSGTDQRKHQSSASPAFERGIHQWPMNSPHKGPGMRKMFSFDNVIMQIAGHGNSTGHNQIRMR